MRLMLTVFWRRCCHFQCCQLICQLGVFSSSQSHQKHVRGNIDLHLCSWWCPLSCCGQESCYWMGEAKIIGNEQDRYKRWIKEAIAIRKKGGTTMNRDEGQYFLSHVFDEILMKTKHPIGRSTGNTESGNTVARRQSTSVSSQ